MAYTEQESRKSQKAPQAVSDSPTDLIRKDPNEFYSGEQPEGTGGVVDVGFQEGIVSPNSGVPEVEEIDLFPNINLIPKEGNLLPIDRQETKRLIDTQASENRRLGARYYITDRSSRELLTPGEDYGELPGFNGLPPSCIIRKLSKGSLVLDVGCGEGMFASDIAQHINPDVLVYGYDGVAQEGQNRLGGIVIDDIDNLTLDRVRRGLENSLPIGDMNGFDLVTSSVLLYHLPDYLGGIARMLDVARPDGGIMLASTFPRPIDFAYTEAFPKDDSSGFPISYDLDLTRYDQYRNIVYPDTELVFPGELVNILNMRNNNRYAFEYGHAKSTSIGARYIGGQISAQRRTREPLEMSNIFYALYKNPRSNLKPTLNYIVARTPDEENMLKNLGYLSLSDRLRE